MTTCIQFVWKIQDNSGLFQNIIFLWKTSSFGRWLMIMEKRYYVSFTVSKSPYHCISMTWWLRTSTKTNPVGTNIPFVFSFTTITVGRCSEIALNFRVQMFLAQFLTLVPVGRSLHVTSTAEGAPYGAFLDFTDFLTVYISVRFQYTHIGYIYLPFLCINTLY